MDSNKVIELKIIKQAANLFLTKGFKSVTMDDLASEMKMSKKTIYTYFKTKNELISSATEEIFNSINEKIETIRNQDLNPIDELFTINDVVFKHLKNESSSPQYQLLKYYPKIHSKLNEKKFTIIHQCITDGLNKGIESGIFRKEIDPEIISRFYFFSITQIKNKELFPESEFNNFKVLKTYLDYHIRAVATEKGIQILNQQAFNLTPNRNL